MMNPLGKKKLKICDFDGRKIDTAVVNDEKEAKKVLNRWKMKGLI